MQFQLVIRNTVEAEGDVFGVADVRHLNDTVTVGTSTKCDVHIDDAELDKEQFFKIQPATDSVQLIKTGRHIVYLNHDPIPDTPPATLVSGDEIRVGHWTFRFQKVRKRVAVAHQFNMLATVAKILIIAIVAAEILLAVWLPRRLQYENMVAIQILEEQCVMQLDNLRHTIDRMAPPTNPTPKENLKAAAVSIVKEELDALAAYIRKYQQKIPANQWTRLRNDLDRIQSLLYRIQSQTIFHPVPEIDLEKSLQTILETPPDQL